MPAKSWFRHPAVSALRYGVSAAFLGWIVWRIDWTGWRSMETLDWTLAIPAFLLAGAAYLLQAWRWQVLLEAVGLRVPARWLQPVFWSAQFYNSFLPGGIGGDAVRFAYLWRDHPERRADAAATLVADRLLGLAALFALAATALAVHLAGHDGSVELHTLLGASLASFAAILAGVWTATRTRWWERVAGRFAGAERIANLQAAALTLGTRHAAMAGAVALSIAVWLIDFAALWLFARAVGIPASPIALAAAGGAAYVAASLPISIGGHGVREGALVATLALLGVGTGQPTAVSALALAFWTASTGWSLLGGIAIWLVPSAAKIDSASAGARG